MQRSDTLFRMFMTLLAAVLCGLVLEAEGLKVWAERLELGPLRSVVLPISQAWHGAVQRVGGDVPRRVLVEVKAQWAGSFAGISAFEATPVSASEEAPVLVEHSSSSAASSTPQPAHAHAPLAAQASAPAQQLVLDKPAAQSSRPAKRAALDPVFPPGFTVALAGDSMMAVGLAPALRRNLDGVHIIKAYRSGTGLARPEVFDWLQKYPLMLGEARPRIVICSLGANDGQNVQLGKEVLAFGSPAWDAYYRQRLTAWLDLLTRDGGQVLWVGMPVMRAPGFARKMEHMNALVQDVLTAYPGVSWLDPNPLLARETGSFAQYRADARGKQIKLRQDDGIHMTDEGALFLLPGIRAWLEQVQSRPATQASAALHRPQL